MLPGGNCDFFPGKCNRFGLCGVIDQRSGFPASILSTAVGYIMMDSADLAADYVCISSVTTFQLKSFAP
jgi:hypothetical protein